MAQDKQKYRLYVLRAEDIPEDAEYFCLLPEAALLYAREAPERAKEVLDTDILPAEARMWLVDSIEQITRKYMRENEDELLAGTKTFMERFRAELERERRGSPKKIRVKARAKGHGE